MGTFTLNHIPYELLPIGRIERIRKRCYVLNERSEQ